MAVTVVVVTSVVLAVPMETALVAAVVLPLVETRTDASLLSCWTSCSTMTMKRMHRNVRLAEVMVQVGVVVQVHSPRQAHHVRLV